MTAKTNQEIVDSVVVDATQDLFAAYDVKVAKQAHRGAHMADDVLYAGVIGFTGPLRGTLVLAPTRTLLERSRQGSPFEYRDWAGELANQLLGRIKNRLRGHGAEIHATTPVVLKGHYFASFPKVDLSLHCFAAAPGNVSVWFDAELADGLTLLARDVQTGLREGEAILF